MAAEVSMNPGWPGVTLNDTWSMAPEELLRRRKLGPPPVDPRSRGGAAPGSEMPPVPLSPTQPISQAPITATPAQPTAPFGTLDRFRTPPFVAAHDPREEAEWFKPSIPPRYPGTDLGGLTDAAESGTDATLGRGVQGSRAGVDATGGTPTPLRNLIEHPNNLFMPPVQLNAAAPSAMAEKPTAGPSQPTPIGPGPATAASPRASGAVDMPPVQGRDYASEYGAELANQPQREQPKKENRWLTALGLGLSFMGGMKDPNVGYQLARGVLEGPERDAEERYKKAKEDWKGKLGGIEKEGELGRAGAQAEEARARAWSLEHPRPERETPHTVETAEGVYEYNPDTRRFDIRVGGPKKEAGSPTPHTVETGRGVYQYNPDTNKYDIYVGPPKREPRNPDEETPAQRLARSKARNQAEREKGEGLRKAEDDIRRRYGLTGFAANEPWPQEATDELEAEKQRVQDEYEQKLGNLGADVSHFDYSSQRGSRTSQRGSAGAPGKVLDRQNPEHRRIAAEILQEAGGDTNKARQIAKQRGYAF